MDKVGAKRYCCRRMLMTHVDLIEKLLQYVEQSLLTQYDDFLACALANDSVSIRYDPAERRIRAQ